MRLIRLGGVALAVVVALATPAATMPCYPTTVLEGGRMVAVYGGPNLIGALRCP